MRNILLYTLLLMTVWGCSQTQEKTSAGQQIAKETTPANSVTISTQQAAQAGIVWDTLRLRNIGVAVAANGTLETPPSDNISITAVMGGIVKKTDLLAGMSVKKGDVLAVLEHPDYIRLQQSYLEARNQLTYAEKELRRQEELMAANATAAQKQEAAENAYNTARIQVRSLGSQLEMLGIDMNALNKGDIQSQIVIRAPISGTVTEVGINTGKFVAANEMICKIISKEHLHIVLKVFERDVMKVRVGQPVTVRIMGAEKAYQAKIILVNRAFDNATKSIEVQAHFDRDDATLKPGMFVEAQIHTNDASYESLPDDALVNEDGKPYAFVLKEQTPDKLTFEKVLVEKIASENGFSAITVPQQWKGKPFVQAGVYYLTAIMGKESE
ncbi:MAG: efflux RND transporter periplasmic adaptor subunit [Cytophagales bacterium]|nr:efflux RND transporter periplasmic adaptor subunit [Bernardetiaceae bacterium]MDW8203765.1 efflux RND transporter periplasmic adaptor subunit [Cytophagales bacterium]